MKKGALNPHGDDFDVMCFPNEAVGYEVVTKPMMASYKLDGMRCFFKKGEMLSRQWKPILNKQLNERFQPLKDITKNKNYILDGELYSHEIDFGEIMHYCRTEDLKDEPLPDNINFYMFDMLIDMKNNRRAEDRNKDLISFFHDLVDKSIVFDNYDFSHVYILTQLMVSTPEDAKKMFEEAVNEGFEGLILKDPDSQYKYGRITIASGDGYKFKPYQTWDARIIDVEQATEADPKAEKTITEKGYSRTSRKKGDRIPIEKASAFRVMYEDKELKVSIAATDEEKEKIWKEKDSYIGKYIEYKGMLVGAKDLPRHPVFVRMRPDKDDEFAEATKPRLSNEEIRKIMEDSAQQLEDKKEELAAKSKESYRKMGRIKPDDLKIQFDI